MKTLTFRIAVILILVLSVLIASAQPPMHANKRMATLKKMKLLEVLELSEEEANKFLVKYDSWTDKIIEEREKLDEIENDLKKALKEGDGNINEFSLKFESRLENIHKQMNLRLQDFRKLLSEDNYARFLIFEKEFPRKVQKEIMKRQRNRMERR